MDSNKDNNFTFRAFLIGAFLCCAMSAWFSYAGIFVQGSDMTQHFPGPGALFLFLILIAVVNLFKRLGGGGGLGRGELAGIYTMMWITIPILSWGLIWELVPSMVGLSYYSTPENHWAELFGQYLPSWAFVQDESAIRGFFEGAPAGSGVPLGIWIIPLLYRAIFLMALYLVMICSMVILRRQWMEREHLVFPLAVMPLEMIGRGGKHKSIFRSRLTWVGFSIPFIIYSCNALHSYYHFLPELKLDVVFFLFNKSTQFEIRVLFYLIGFTYLVNLKVAFSLWFFSLIGSVQTGILRMLGWSLGPREVCTASGPSVSHQGMGALIVFVLLGLWNAREHIRNVFRKAFKEARDVDDSDEVLSYRHAVTGMIAGTVVMFVWLRFSGLGLWNTAFFLFGAFVIFLALTRVVAEGGTACVKSPLTPQSFAIHGLGNDMLGTRGMSSLLTTFCWASEMKTLVMTSAANSLKIVGDVGVGRRRWIFWAMLSAIVIGMITSTWVLLTLAYKYGGLNLHPYIQQGGYGFGRFVAELMRNPSTTDGWRWVFTGIGAVVMAALMILHHRFLWWPLHPIGFTVGNTLPLIHTWFSIFVAWVLKSIVLKYGGAMLYKQLRPFFLGLILGHVSVAGFWLIIDYFTGVTGNIVPFEF